MSISIVTVVLDAGPDLPLTIESVRQQEFDGELELIVVDGGSCDGTADVLALYADMIDKVVRLEDAGIYHAMNAALDHCRHEYVLFLNAKDTLFSAAALRNLMACKRPEADVVFGNHVYVSGRKASLKRSIAYEVSMDLLRRGLVDHTWLSRLPGHQATLVRLELLRKLRFSTTLGICADHDLLVRAYNEGANFQYIDETISYYVGGGFSAQAPAKLLLEWCALYREQSNEPEAIDRFFLGDTPSPFGPQNAQTGDWVCGNYPLEPAQSEHGLRKPVAWCRPGIKLRTPARGATVGLRIEGYNPFDGQLLTFFSEDRELAELRLEKGWFRQDLRTVPLPPLSIVDVTATRLGVVAAFPGRTVVIALASFAFESAKVDRRPFVPGDRIPFTRVNAARTMPLLGAGWSEQEELLIWTIGEMADLRLLVSAQVRTLILVCRANPFIEAPQDRGVEVSVNDQSVGRHLLPGDDDVSIEVDVGQLVKDGRLTIALRPLLRVAPPIDGRPLGVALTSIRFR